MSDDLVKSYNHNLKMLIHILNNKYENKNKDIIELSRLLSTALSIDLNVVIEESGPYLIKNHSGLNDLDKFVTETQFDDQITAKEKSDQRLVRSIIDAIKTVWPSMNPKEKEIIVKIIKNLMTEYSQYIMSKK